MKVFNNRNEEVYSQILRPNIPQLFNDNLEEDLEVKNFRNSKIQDVDNIKTHQLLPVTFENHEFK